MRLLMIAAGLLCLMWAEPAFACSCASPNERPTASAYRLWLDSYDGVVFRGTPIRSEPMEGQSFLVTFRVERHWKGITASEVVIFIPGLCGGGYPAGATYLVAAERKDGRLSTAVCSSGDYFTRREKEFLSMLGEGSPPPTQSPR